jgi:hypothetical protein
VQCVARCRSEPLLLLALFEITPGNVLCPAKTHLLNVRFVIGAKAAILRTVQSRLAFPFGRAAGVRGI